MTTFKKADGDEEEEESKLGETEAKTKANAVQPSDPLDALLEERAQV